MRTSFMAVFRLRSGSPPAAGTAAPFLPRRKKPVRSAGRNPSPCPSPSGGKTSPSDHCRICCPHRKSGLRTRILPALISVLSAHLSSYLSDIAACRFRDPPWSARFSTIPSCPRICSGRYSFPRFLYPPCCPPRPGSSGTCRVLNRVPLRTGLSSCHLICVTRFPFLPMRSIPA